MRPLRILAWSVSVGLFLSSCGGCGGGPPGGTGGGPGGSSGAGGGAAAGTGGSSTDTDCDGISDSDESSGAAGCVTNPSKADTDGDGLPDGVEAGIVAPGPPSGCAYAASSFDADPTTKTDACSADSDGDGIPDGLEDSDHNGRKDPGELDPKNPADGTGPVADVCTPSKVRPVAFINQAAPNLHLGLPSGYHPSDGGRWTPITVGTTTRGVAGYHAASKTAFIALTEPARNDAGTPQADETALRAVLATRGALSNATVQTFPTWDGHRAVKVFYTQAGTGDVITQADALATALTGAAAGVLTGTAGATGPFRLEAQIAHRSSTEVAVVISLTSATNFVEPAIFTLEDTAGGSALAASADVHDLTCEPFTTAVGKVDILFSVDDSTSMGAKQQALADVAAQVALRLGSTTLDYRIAMVTTSYLAAPLAGSNHGVIRGFTRDINQLRAWLTQNSVCTAGNCTLVTPAAACDSNGAAPDGRNGGCWIGAGGTGNIAAEAILGAARKGVDDLSPATAAERPDKFRADAQVAVILVGDADDQTTGYLTSAGSCSGANSTTCEPVQNFIKYFSATGTTAMVDKNPLGKKLVVHLIACPDGQNCSETQSTPRRHFQVATALGGVTGDINDTVSIQTSMAAIVSNIIGNASHRLRQPPIGASLKVALASVQNPAQCEKTDLPRSVQNGFDVDGLSQSVVFYGACRPSAPGTNAALSYRYWIKKAATGCAPIDCGGSCSTGSRCNPASCACEPDIQ